MEKITNKQFYDFIGKILYYLSQYVDISKISKNYDNTQYILTDSEENTIRVDKNKYDKVKVKEDSGVTITPVIYKLKGYKVANQICFVRNLADTAEDIKQTMFHELMHAGASKKEIVNKKNVVYKTGIYTKNYRFTLLNPYESTSKYQYLNEAMTELVAKFIYDKVNDTKYNIVRKSDRGYRVSIYNKGYFLLAFLFLNYFEEHPEVLFDIYFNNNIELFKTILAKKSNLTIDELDDIITKSIQNPDDEELNVKIDLLISQLYRKEPIKNKNVMEQYLL